MSACVTFLLPGDNRSGGVRVTTLMANLLLQRGYTVRIAHPTFWRQLRVNPWLLAPWSKHAKGWLHDFRGPIQEYRDINQLRFSPGEIVIGVGTFMIDDLQALRAPEVTKIRYNHGFPARMTPAVRAAWSLPIPTITVSPTLVPQLERLSALKVRAVIPNGIDPAQYFPLPATPRDGVGTIFSPHPNKAPQDIIRLFRRIGEAFPGLPRIVFGMEQRPRGLEGSYERCPSIPRARELYNQAMVWVLASHTEGLPGPVLEAMACGAVVVSTDNDGSLAVIADGQNGLIVPRGDIEAFIERIQLLRADPELRGRLSQAGLATAARFTWARAADAMHDFLQTLAPAAVLGA